MAAFVLQWQSWVVGTRTAWPCRARNIYYLGLYRNRLLPLLYTHAQGLSGLMSIWKGDVPISRMRRTRFKDVKQFVQLISGRSGFRLRSVPPKPALFALLFAPHSSILPDWISSPLFLNWVLWASGVDSFRGSEGTSSLILPEKAGWLPGSFVAGGNCYSPHGYTDSLLEIKGVWNSWFINTFEVWCQFHKDKLISLASQLLVASTHLVLSAVKSSQFSFASWIPRAV